jgi:hypothetical protein
MLFHISLFVFAIQAFIMQIQEDNRIRLFLQRTEMKGKEAEKKE